MVVLHCWRIRHCLKDLLHVVDVLKLVTPTVVLGIDVHLRELGVYLYLSLLLVT